MGPHTHSLTQPLATAGCMIASHRNTFLVSILGVTGQADGDTPANKRTKVDQS